MKDRSVGPDLEIVPLLEQTAPSDLGTARRTHSDSHVAVAAPVETIDDDRPIPTVTHNGSPSLAVDRESPNITSNTGKDPPITDFFVDRVSSRGNLTPSERSLTAVHRKC